MKYFLALCERRNFTHAAKQCGVSQPSLSNAIKALEGELGGELIHRHPFALTPLGKAVRPHLRNALRHMSLARNVATVQRREQLSENAAAALPRDIAPTTPDVWERLPVNQHHGENF